MSAGRFSWCRRGHRSASVESLAFTYKGCTAGTSRLESSALRALLVQWVCRTGASAGQLCVRLLIGRHI